jgi:uncharacterized protein YyaL (SSP411 family)
MRRLVITSIIAASLLVPASVGAASLGPTQSSYRSLADRGVKNAHAMWFNRKLHWYDNRLNSHKKFPLATIWSLVPLFEADNALAIADHSHAHVAAVRKIASGAEKYFNRAMHGYGPYKGDRDRETVWFDDNGWWGMAFMDAWRATGNRRYVKDADRAFRFVARRGWASNGGMWWNTDHPYKSGEALASDVLLGAWLYRATHKAYYLAQVDKWIAWADQHMVSRNGQYGIRDTDSSPTSYVEGPMLEAQQVLCEATGQQARCDRAADLADKAYDQFGQDLNMGPQFDTIYLRSLLFLYSRDHDPRWYELAVHNAERVQQNAATGGGLYLAAWDGGPITRHGAETNMIQTHAAAVELFAWLAGATPPPGS